MQNAQQVPTSMIPAPAVRRETIAAGPTKFELMLGLFDNVGSKGRTVTFTVGRGSTVEVVINEVGRESGDGESWLFEGYVPGGAESVEGYYSTDTNSGWLNRTTR